MLVLYWLERSCLGNYFIPNSEDMTCQVFLLIILMSVISQPFGMFMPAVWP